MRITEFEICNNLKGRFTDERIEVVIGHSFTNKERLKFHLDIAVKDENEIVAIFEVKNKIIDSDMIKGIYAKQCRLYSISFPLSKPLIYLTDGNYYYEYDGKQFKSCNGFDAVVNAIKGKLTNKKKPDYNSFIKFLDKNSEIVGDSFINDIQEKIKGNDDARKVFNVSNGTFSFNSEY